MPDATAALTALRDELEQRGLIRRPGIAGPLPPAHIEPRGGPPAPGEREIPETDGDLVVTLRLSSELGASGGAARFRTVIIDAVYRSSTTAGLKAGRALDSAIADVLTGQDTYGVGVTLAGLFVLQASVYGGIGPVADVAGVRTEAAKYALELLR